MLTPAGILSTMVVGLVGVVILIAFRSGAWIFGVFMITPGLLILVWLLVFFLKAWVEVFASRGERVKRSWLAARSCPSCGYGLEGLEADARGVVRCPECGAGWIRDPKPEPRRVVIRDWARPRT